MVSEMVQLPNKDLWRGHVRVPKPSANVEMTEEPRPFAKIDEAMANLLKQAKGASVLTCTWCGQQGDERNMREHLKTSHASIVNPPDDKEIAAATLAMDKKK